MYFARVSKHYLRLVKNEPCVSDSSRQDLQHPIIIDSGANYYMFQDKKFFTTLSLANGKVILGDGKTSLPILGVGTVTCIIGGHELQIENVHYVPTLSESIYSLFLHIQLPDHSVRSCFESGLFLQFPTFETKAIVGQNDLYLDATPLRSIPDSNDASHVTDCSPSVCRNFSTFQEEINEETNRLDNLLLSLSQYYDTIKTKRQLQMEMPAGFRHISNHQRDYQSYLHLHKQIYFRY